MDQEQFEALVELIEEIAGREARWHANQTAPGRLQDTPAYQHAARCLLTGDAS